MLRSRFAPRSRESSSGAIAVVPEPETETTAANGYVLFVCYNTMESKKKTKKNFKHFVPRRSVVTVPDDRLDRSVDAEVRVGQVVRNGFAKGWITDNICKSLKK